MREERSLQTTLSGIDDLNAALAWVIQKYDQEFDGASIVRISVERTLVNDAQDPRSDLRPEWSATIGGLVSERDVDV